MRQPRRSRCSRLVRAPLRRSLPADSAGYDARVRAVATVAARLGDHAADVAWLGTEEVIAERLARDRAALDKYTATGEVDYVPAADFSRGDVANALAENVLAFHRVAEPPVQRALVSEHQRFPETHAALAQLPREMRDEQPP